MIHPSQLEGYFTNLDLFWSFRDFPSKKLPFGCPGPVRSRANLTKYISPSHSEIRPSDVGLTTIWAVLAAGVTWDMSEIGILIRVFSFSGGDGLTSHDWSAAFNLLPVPAKAGTSRTSSGCGSWRHARIRKGKRRSPVFRGGNVDRKPSHQRPMQAFNKSWWHPITYKPENNSKYSLKRNYIFSIGKLKIFQPKKKSRGVPWFHLIGGGNHEVG